MFRLFRRIKHIDVWSLKEGGRYVFTLKPDKPIPHNRLIRLSEQTKELAKKLNKELGIKSVVLVLDDLSLEINKSKE